MLKSAMVGIFVMLGLVGEAWAGNPVVVMETSMGTVEIELDEGKAPVTVKNFLSYVDKKFYDGTVFHRVIKDFMIQGGGFSSKDNSLDKKPTDAPIKNEADNGLKNDRGTIAMARTMDPNSATAQFFINHKDNVFLNYVSPAKPGYAVFGKVTAGMDVVDKIAVSETGSRMGMRDVPVKNIVIKSVVRKAGDTAAKAADGKEKTKTTK